MSEGTGGNRPADEQVRDRLARAEELLTAGSGHGGTRGEEQIYYATLVARGTALFNEALDAARAGRLDQADAALRVLEEHYGTPLEKARLTLRGSAGGQGTRFRSARPEES